MKPVILFVVNGLGLGNSTRSHAVISRLAEAGAKVHVVTSGNGLWYFKDRADIAGLYEMDSLRYISCRGRLSAWATLFSVPAQFRLLLRKRRRVMDLIRRLRPAAVVVDSEYVFLRSRALGAPVVALNNADVVCSVFAQAGRRVPASVKAQFYLVEKLDRLYHRHVPELVVSPCLDRRFRPLRAEDNALAAGPIIRPRLLERVPARGGGVVIMLSGSVFGTQVGFRPEPYPMRIDVIGRAEPEGWKARPDVIFHGRCREVAELVAGAGLVVVNGGFSAVSEMFCLRKPMLVVPVPGHAEQWLNAYMIERLGVGAIAAEDGINARMLDMLGRLSDFTRAYENLAPAEDGAAQAAGRIMRLVVPAEREPV